jgi:SAM-dependent methyltransferase
VWPRRRRAPRGAPDVPTLAAEHLEAGDPTGWFEPLYAGARRDLDAVPWAEGAAHPYVTDWLDDPVSTPPGRRAAVVGCGLGDDAAELARRGYDVVAFDVAPSAVAWARERHRGIDVDWRVVDALEPPDELIGAFDLVLEVRTVPSLPGVVREAAMDAIGRLVAERGVLVVVTLVATSTEAADAWSGPPWVQAPSELATYRSSGLVRLAMEHPPSDPSGVLEARVTWQRPAGADPRGGPRPGGTLPLA